MSSTVDFVIPAYNPNMAHLAKAVESALSVPACGKIIVVDDGSAPPVCLNLGMSCQGKVTVIRQDNKGPSSARNQGLSLAVSDWILFLDADDEVIPGGVESVIALAQHLRAGIAISSRIECDEAGYRRINAAPAEWSGRTLPSRADVFRPIALFSTTGVMVARDVIESGVRFDESLVYGEDRDFLYNAGRLTRIAVGARPLVMQRVYRNGGNLRSPRKLSSWLRDHIVLVEKHLPESMQFSGDAEDWSIKRKWFCKQSMWLANAASKSGVDVMTWASFRGLCAQQGWSLPLKIRARTWLRCLVQRVRASLARKLCS